MNQTDFEELITKWSQTGIVSEEQAQYMVADLKSSTAEHSGKKFVAAVATIGAGVLVAGMLLLIASNWQFLGKPVQVFLALLLPVIPICAAYFFLVVRSSQSVLVMVANVFGIGLIGGSLALIGQIYNLESGYTTLLWLWTILSSPFIFVFRRPENMVLSAVLLGFALMSTLVDLIGWADESAFVLTLTVCALAYAGSLYAVGVSLRHSSVWADGARLLRLLSASVASAMLFVTTFEFYARIITDAGASSLAWVPLSVVLNLVFIGFMIFVLIKAFRYQEERLAFGVVRLMFLYVIVKYFTLFSDMLDTGVLLVFGGILFIAGAWYLEKHKASLLALMRREVTDESVTANPFSPHTTRHE